MVQIKRDIQKLYGIEGDWYEMIFTCHNPTASDVYFDMFNPMVAQGYNVPNTPNGYVQPPAVYGSTAPSIPSLGYPSIGVTDTYPFIGTNNTMAYDSIHSRMYMTYLNLVSGNIYLTWKDSVNSFVTSQILITFSNPLDFVVDTAISTTSNKIFVLSSMGELFIYDTNTNTLITSFTLPAYGVSLANQMEWNSVKNTFYITIANPTNNILEVDAVAYGILATIPTGVGTNPYSITFKALTNEMFVTYLISNQIAKINCTLNTISIIIAATITASCDVIFYNPITDLVTYGSSSNVGIRTFNATTLVFHSVVIARKVSAIGLYPSDNKLYLISSIGIGVLDGTTLSALDLIIPTYINLNKAEITFYPPDDEMYYNLDRAIPKSILSVGRIKKNIVFWIDGSADYNVTIRDFFNSPAWIRRIYYYSYNENNFKQILTHVYKDANGNEVQMPRIPSLSVGINQFQGWMGELDFETPEMVLGINQWFQNVLIKAGTELTFLMIYKQIDKSNMLSVVSPIGEDRVGGETAICTNELRRWSEKDLSLNDFSRATLYKQNMYLGQDEPSVVPFSLNLYNDVEIQNLRKDNSDNE